MVSVYLGGSVGLEGWRMNEFVGQEFGKGERSSGYPG